MKKKNELKICILGLGYVGLPLAISLAKHFKSVGYDTNNKRVSEIQSGVDATEELSCKELKRSKLQVTNSLKDIIDCNLYIIAVPTPVDGSAKPDLSLLKKASQTIGKVLKKDDIVVFESTVYPGVTEDFCAPILENYSGLTVEQDFFLGYSPERINPGDAAHSLEGTVKIIAAHNQEAQETLKFVYSHVCKDVFLAKSIKVAEAAKVIENTQRDINIAFINEITIILNRLGLSIYDVLEAAKTKWNFLDFSPGFVGGHCIGVDPHYLAECAQQVGYKPNVILAGRKVNEDMGFYIAQKINNALYQQYGEKGVRILVLGLTFKEDIRDLRNSKVANLIHALKRQGHNVDVYDPYACGEEAWQCYEIRLMNTLEEAKELYDCIIGAVSHKCFKEMTREQVAGLIYPTGMVVDIKKIWPFLNNTGEMHYWTL